MILTIRNINQTYPLRVLGVCGKTFWKMCKSGTLERHGDWVFKLVSTASSLVLVSGVIWLRSEFVPLHEYRDDKGATARALSKINETLIRMDAKKWEDEAQSNRLADHEQRIRDIEKL